MGKISPELGETIKRFWESREDYEIEVIIKVAPKVRGRALRNVKRSARDIKQEVEDSTMDLIDLLKKEGCKYFVNPWSRSIKAYVTLKFIHEKLRPRRDVDYVYIDSPVYEATLGEDVTH